MLLQCLLKHQRHILPQMRAGHQEKGVAVNVIASSGHQTIERFGDGRLCQFHETRLDVFVAEARSEALDKTQHDIVAFLPTGTMCEHDDPCFVLHETDDSTDGPFMVVIRQARLSMLVSIIVPTFNHAPHLAVTLQQLREQPDVELIVVDGGSTDASADIARRFTPYVFVSHPGRARQMNDGARHATGDILLFLHPDTFLLSGATLELQRRIIAASAVGGAFDLHMDSPRWLCRVVSRLSSAWARLWRLPRGEQGIFVWRQVFEKIGGFPNTPILEDGALARRLRRAGRLTFIPDGLIVSARRWHAHGVLRTSLVDVWIRFLAFLRLPPSELRRIYDGWMSAGKVGVSVDSPRQSAGAAARNLSG